MELNFSDIGYLFQQLNNRQFPFSSYEFYYQNGMLNKIGQGGFATVFSACKRGGKKDNYIIKVVGLQDKQLDWEQSKSSFSKMSVIAEFCESIAPILKFIDLTIWLDGEKKIQRVEKGHIDETLDIGTECLYLQFILMHKYQSIISYSTYGRPSLAIEKLKNVEEMEMVHLAYDISTALHAMHREGILHRDIKLENVLYDRKKKRYLLSDFDVIKEIGDDFAKTRVGTNGYVAPEVLATFQEYYDYTADIYSLGMLLYVLLNGFKFPETTNYKSSNNKHYRPNYILPKPEYTQDTLFSVVEKMCAYNPDDRYQTMEEVVEAIEVLLLPQIAAKRNHKMFAFVFGGTFLTVGLFLMSLFPEKIFATQRVVDWKLVLFGLLCLWKVLPKQWGSRNILSSIGILILGLLAEFPYKGVAWYFLLGLICIDLSAGMSFAGFILTLGPYLFQGIKVFLQLGNLPFPPFSWISGSLVVVGIMLLGYFVCMNSRSQLWYIRFMQKYYFYCCLLISFAMHSIGKQFFFFQGLSVTEKANIMKQNHIMYNLPLSYGWMEKYTWYSHILSYDMEKIGDIGYIFCILYIVLEAIHYYSGVYQKKRIF